MFGAPYQSMNELLIPVASIIVVVLSVFATLFLFWRACRHELFDNEQIFDIVLIGSLGGLIFGRIIGFLLLFETYGASFNKLVFFHLYPAFSFWGYVLGAFLAVSIFLRHKRTSVWSFFDLAAAPIIFGLFLTTFLKGIIDTLDSVFDYRLYILAFIYFVFFFALKRLATKKRHLGYFACLFLTLTPLINIAFMIVQNGPGKFSTPDKYLGYLLLAALLFGLFCWYRVAGRKLRVDIKLIFGFVFLRALGFLRVIKSPDEAGKVSKFVIYSPYSIGRGILLLLRGFFKEIKEGMLEFFYILGFKR